jgi:hypothetical protein
MMVAAAAMTMLTLSLLPAKAEDEKWDCIWSGGTWVTNGFGGSGFCYRTLPSAFHVANHVTPGHPGKVVKTERRAKAFPRLPRSFSGSRTHGAKTTAFPRMSGNFTGRSGRFAH